jgi:molybdopterin molybdotransferase
MIEQMISEQEAYHGILNSVTPLAGRSVILSEALNQFTAEDCLARTPLPNFDNSAMDGYAVIASECRPGTVLKLVGEQPAGVDRKLRVGPGETVRIFTGAPIPAGGDAVVMQEDVTADGAQIVINTEVQSAEFIRSRGSDVAEGQKLAGKGERLRAVTLGALAAQGFAKVKVGEQPMAAVLSTGDELVTAGEPLEPGQIYESNSVLLSSLLRQAGAKLGSVQHCQDNEEALIAALSRLSTNNILLISGGVSVGERDLVKAALKHVGGDIHTWRVAIKPGKPFLHGRIGECHVFGLPGNPVSGFVTFLKFVRPAILTLMGAGDDELSLRRIPARLRQDITGDGERPHYIRGALAGAEFVPVGRQESHAIFGLSRSNALLRVAAGEQCKAGDLVEVEIWD